MLATMPSPRRVLEPLVRWQLLLPRLWVVPLLVVTLVCAVVAALSAEWRAPAYDSRAVGEVTATTSTRWKVLVRDRVYAVDVAYRDAGGTARTVRSFAENTRDLASVTVEYRASDPASARVVGMRAAPLNRPTALAAFALAVVCAIMTWRSLAGYARRRRVFELGDEVQARVLEQAGTSQQPGTWTFVVEPGPHGGTTTTIGTNSFEQLPTDDTYTLLIDPSGRLSPVSLHEARLVIAGDRLTTLAPRAQALWYPLALLGGTSALALVCGYVVLVSR